MNAADIEAAFAAEKAATGRKCKVGRQIEALTPEDQSLVEAKLNDQSYPTDVLVRVFGRLGVILVTSNTLSAHRRGLCPCANA